MNRILFGLGVALFACLPNTAHADEGKEGEKPAATKKAPSRWEALKQRFDLNEDGRITWEEYRKVTSGFTALDQDGDGVITKKDADKLPAAPGIEQLQKLLAQLGGQGAGGLQSLQGLPGLGGRLPFAGGQFPGMGGGSPFMGGAFPIAGGQLPGMGGGFPGMGGGFPGMGGGFPGMGVGFPGMGGRFPGMGGGFPGMGGGFPGMGSGFPGMGGPFPGMGGQFPGTGGPFPGKGGLPQGAKSLEELLAKAKDAAAKAGKGEAPAKPPFDLGSMFPGGTPVVMGGNAGDLAIVLVAKKADTDEDGTLSKAEWSAWLKTLDADEKGAVKSEKLAALFPAQLGGFAATLVQSLFDHDRDGTLEVADLEAAHKAADKDGDGAIVIKDLVPAGAMGLPFGK